VLNSMALVAGFLVLRLGSRWTCIIGACIITVGAVLMGFSSPHIPAYTAAYIIMGAGGPLVAFSMFSLPALAPKHSGLLFSLIVGAFDGSAAIMFLFQLLYVYLDISMPILFWGFAVVSASLVLAAFFIFVPRKSDSEAQALLTKPPYQQDSIFKMVKSGPFWFIVLWGCLYVLTKYFYMTTVEKQLFWLTNNPSQVNIGAFVFSILLPCSAIFTPVTSFILDNFGAHIAILIMALISLVTAVCSIIRIYELQYVTMTCMVFNRFFFFATAPYLMGKLFGPTGPATLYGIVSFSAACVNYSNYLWDYLVINYLGGGFLVINLAQNLLCSVVGCALFLFTWRALTDKKEIEFQGVN